MTDAPSQPPADWYPDPDTPGTLRYWDGTTWTEHRHTPTEAAPPSKAEQRRDALEQRKADIQAKSEQRLASISRWATDRTTALKASSDARAAEAAARKADLDADLEAKRAELHERATQQAAEQASKSADLAAARGAHRADVQEKKSKHAEEFERRKAEHQAKVKVKTISFTRANYLGGLPHDSKSHAGNLYVTPECIGVGTFGPKKAVVPWDVVQSVSFGSESAAKSRAGAVVLFGVFGLAAKNRKDEGIITVTLTDGTAALYQVDNVNGSVLRGKLGAMLHALGVTVV